MRREKARLEREPITNANIDAATSGPDISEEEHEVILQERFFAFVLLACALVCFKRL